MHADRRRARALLGFPHHRALAGLERVDARFAAGREQVARPASRARSSVAIALAAPYSRSSGCATTASARDQSSGKGCNVRDSPVIRRAYEPGVRGSSGARSCGRRTRGGGRRRARRPGTAARRRRCRAGAARGSTICWAIDQRVFEQLGVGDLLAGGAREVDGVRRDVEDRDVERDRRPASRRTAASRSCPSRPAPRTPSSPASAAVVHAPFGSSPTLSPLMSLPSIVVGDRRPARPRSRTSSRR